MHHHDDVTLRRVRRVLNDRIWPAVHATSVPLEVTAAELPGEPVPPGEGLTLQGEPFAVGDSWGPSWGTTWFRLRGTVPPEWAGRPVEAVIDLGWHTRWPGFQCEGLVYRPDGTPVKAINPENRAVPLIDAAAGGETIELVVEASANPELPGKRLPEFAPTAQGDLATASRSHQYVAARFDVAVFEAEVHALALDVDVLLELAEQLPAGLRRARILQGLDDALDALDLQDVAATAPAARARLAPLLASPAEASAHVLSAIGHAHIDSAWLWPVRETIRKVARTTSSMCALIEQTDDFIYGMSSAQQYAWLKEHRPEVWERVVEAVASGRFVPLGGMWVESDTVMPSGESMVRQFSQGQRFFARELGVRCTGVWLPDSFGYSPALPQLVRRAGFEWFFTQKISWNRDNVFPHHTFWWEGIDGSRTLTHFPPMDTYSSRLSGEEVARATQQFRESRYASGSIAPVGHGDGGGGTTREMVGKARRLADLEGSAKVVWEHPDAFYDRARAELSAQRDAPVWVGELYLEAHRATLTSQHQTKAGNRRNEHLLVEAEGWAAAATVRTGAPYAQEALDRLWQDVLLLQFHDILPGSSIAWVHREAVEKHAAITAEAEQIVATALAALTQAPAEDPPAEDSSARGARTALVANGAAVARGGVAPFAIGAAVPGRPVSLTVAGDGGWVLANELVTVRIDGAGHVVSAVDHATGRDAVAPGRRAGVLHLHQDFPNKFDAWDLDRFYRNTLTELTGADAVTAEAGPDGVARVRTARSFGTSRVTQVISLAPGSRVLEYEQVTDWHETEKILKVAFPLDVRATHTIAETQFGAYERVTHANTSWDAAKFEMSMHRFVLAQEPGFGAALVNDSVYGYDVLREVADAQAVDGVPEVTTTLRLSLLRAPRFPDPHTDQGVQAHRYGLVIGADLAAATEAGIAFEAPRREIEASAAVPPLVTATGRGIVVSAIKLADDGSGDLVVRVHEALGARTTGSVSVDADLVAAGTATLLEEPLDDVALADGRTTAVALGPFEVRTLRFRRAA